ncbi:MAG TPA: histidine phosphatase family protein [Pyrinomonadaceae bacterium]|nr:histidine phosphatase family protein [Pyrinomonadaceae bacterium]
MKSLLLLRHARPSATSPTGRDIDRPLVEEGRAAASHVGQLLRQKQIKPEVVLSSPAVRARETAELVSEAAGLATQTRFDARIYEASLEELLQIVSEAEDGVETLLLVGHNPGLAELLASLTGESAAMSPATLARIELDINAWSELRASQAGRLVFIQPPDASPGH